MRKLVWPDYKKCIANLPNSILKKFGAQTVGDTLPLLDKYLEKDYKNIVVIYWMAWERRFLKDILMKTARSEAILPEFISRCFCQPPLLPRHQPCRDCSLASTAGLAGTATIRRLIRISRFSLILNREQRCRRQITMCRGR